MASICWHLLLAASLPTFFLLTDNGQGVAAQRPQVAAQPFAVQLLRGSDSAPPRGEQHRHAEADARLLPAGSAAALAAKASDGRANARASQTREPEVSGDQTGTPATFHPASALTKKPELIGTLPAIVDLALENMRSGYVIFRLSIDRFGVVKRIQTVRSSLARDVEAELVVPLYRARYDPGEIDGIAVDSQTDLLFELHP